MTYKSDIALKIETDSVIKVNGNREITPPLDNGLRTNIIDSKLNIAGGNVLLALTGYTTELTPSDDKHLTPKKYVDDSDSLLLPIDGSRTMTGDISFSDITKGLMWGTDYIDGTGGVLNIDTQTSGNDISIYAGNNLNLRSAGDIFLEPATLVHVSSADVEFESSHGLTWGISGVYINLDGTDMGIQNTQAGGNVLIDCGTGGAIILGGPLLDFNTTASRFSSLTASTVAYLDASKNLVSLANASGVLRNNGSGTLSYDNTVLVSGGPLGTPSSGTLTSCTGLPISTGVSGLGTGVSSMLAFHAPLRSYVTGSDATETGTSLADITGLSVALEASSTYEVEVMLRIGMSADTTGAQYGINYDVAGATISGFVSGSATSTTAKFTSISAFNTASPTYAVTSSMTGGILIKATVITGVNAGNLTAQMLKVASGTATAFIGSYIKATKIS